MQMTKFRVQNYKRVGDTGWVTAGRLTIFVGKNEAPNVPCQQDFSE